MGKVSDLPTEVQTNLCSKACIETVKKYRDHNQGMSDNLKRLEKDIKDYVRIVLDFEEQIKAYQANELQHSYDTNYWKWEKNDYELKLKKSKEENEKIKGELEKVKLDVEKFSTASKHMESIMKAQIFDKLKHGIGYNATPPPYNNNYFPPKSDLLENMNRKDLPIGSTEVDPQDKVDVEEEPVEKKKSVSDEIPLENQILTNEEGGKPFVKSKEIKSSEKGKAQRVHYMQTTVVNPSSCEHCACKKNEKFNPQKHDNKRGNQRNWNNQWAQRQGVDLNKINRPMPCFICGKLNHIAKHCYFNPINQRMFFQRNFRKHVGYRKDIRKSVDNNWKKTAQHSPIKSKSHTKKRKEKDFSENDTPLFPTMMVVSQTNEGMASRSMPKSDQPIDVQTPPSTSKSNPQSPIQKQKPSITITYKRKKLKTSSFVESKSPKPSSPLLEHSPIENIHRESPGVSPSPKATKSSSDPSKVVKTPKEGEDRYTYDELMDTLGTISKEVDTQQKEIVELKKVILKQQVEPSKLKKLVMKLVSQKKRTKFVLRKRKILTDASKKREYEAEPKKTYAQVKGETTEEAETASAAVNAGAAET